MNIDKENPVYWKKSGKIFAKLERFDEADYSFIQAVNYGNYELDTWTTWAKTRASLEEFDSAIEVLYKGLNFMITKLPCIINLLGFI